MNNIKVQITDTYRQVDFNSARLKKMLCALCGRFAVRRADISIAIVDDASIKKINKEFFGRSYVTDVISFDLSDEDGDGRVFELVVNAQESRRQAKKRDHSDEAELSLYVVHGFLHDVGFDDAKPRDAVRMHTMEDEILEEFGYGMTYQTVPQCRGRQKRE
ncbi:MAG: rRNA maturation RNase YbeY [Sedimentisphaerales bacterium]|nr:rRNA maturation RNase YbeY [Sedimentisphaerales bacterium]